MIDADDFTQVSSKKGARAAKKKSNEATGTSGTATGEKDGLTTSFKTHIRAEFTVATNPDNGTTKFNAYAAMKDLVTVLLAADNGNMVIRNQRDMNHKIEKIEDFPSGQVAFKRFFTDGTMSGHKKDSLTLYYGFFIDTSYTSDETRFTVRNAAVWAHLQTNNVYLRPHAHETFTIQKVGFITMVPLNHIWRQDFESNYNEAMAEKYKEHNGHTENPPKIELRPASKAYQFQTYDEQGDRHRYARGDTLEVLCESEQADKIRNAMTEVSGTKWGKFIPYGMGKDKDVYPIVIQEHNAYLETITSFDVYGMKEEVLNTRFENKDGLEMTLRELAEADTIFGGEEGEVNEASTIISVERTLDSNTKGKWRIITTKDKLKEAHEKVKKILVGKGMQTEYYSQYKNEPNFQAISTDPSLAAYLERYEQALVKTVQYGEYRPTTNPYRTKKRLVQITYDAETFPDLAAQTTTPYTTRPTPNRTPPNATQQATVTPSTARGYTTNQQDKQPTYADKTSGKVPDQIAPTPPLDERKTDPTKTQKKQSLNESYLDDETVVSGNTATTMGTNFAQWQEQMMRTMQATFQTFATTVTEAQAKIHNEQAAAQARVSNENIARQDRVNQVFLDRLEASERTTNQLAAQIGEMARRNAESDQRAATMNQILNSTAGAVTSIHTREERARIMQYHAAQRMLAEQTNEPPPPPLRVPPAIYDVRERRMMTYDDVGRPIAENTETLEDPEQETPPGMQAAEPMDEDKPLPRKSSLAVAAGITQEPTTPTAGPEGRPTSPNRNTRSGRLSSLATAASAVTTTLSTLDMAVREQVAAYRSSGAADTPIAHGIRAATQHLIAHKQRVASTPRTTTLQESLSETAKSLIADRERLAKRPPQGMTTPLRNNTSRSLANAPSRILSRTITTPSTLEMLESSDDETQYTDDKVEAMNMMEKDEESIEAMNMVEKDEESSEGAAQDDVTETDEESIEAMTAEKDDEQSEGAIQDDATSYGDIENEDDNWEFDDDDDDDDDDTEADENSVVKTSDFEAETEEDDMDNDNDEVDDTPDHQHDLSQQPPTYDRKDYYDDEEEEDVDLGINDDDNDDDEEQE
jgi:hypothetical protein